MNRVETVAAWMMRVLSECDYNEERAIDRLMAELPSRPDADAVRRRLAIAGVRAIAIDGRPVDRAALS